MIAGPRVTAPSSALASRAAGLCGPPAAARSCKASRQATIAVNTSASLGAGSGATPVSVGPSSSAMSSMIASFLFWSSGMKDAAVTTCATSGKAPRRSASACASLREKARISAV